MTTNQTELAAKSEVCLKSELAGALECVGQSIHNVGGMLLAVFQGSQCPLAALLWCDDEISWSLYATEAPKPQAFVQLLASALDQAGKAGHNAWAHLRGEGQQMLREFLKRGGGGFWLKYDGMRPSVSDWHVRRRKSGRPLDLLAL